MKSAEIAKLAGVSRSTVSRVLNNYANVPQETHDKVMRIVKQYNYVPNLSAQILAGKSANVIGLFIIAVHESDIKSRIYSSNYFAPFLDAVVDWANNEDSYVLVNTISEDADYAKVRQAYFQKRIDSAIIVGSEKKNKYVIELMELGIPMVVIGYDPAQVPEDIRCCRLGFLNSTDYKGAYEAMEYVVSLGHREIGILNGNMATLSGRERLRAYIDVMKKYELPVHKQFILNGEFSGTVTATRIEEMIQGGKIPTAMFCANDDMAVSAIKVFNQHGYAVPDDISIVGFDDISMASLLTPPLTTVRVSIYHMAEDAVKCVKRLIQNEEPTVEIMQASTELIIRESCKRLKD